MNINLIYKCKLSNFKNFIYGYSFSCFKQQNFGYLKPFFNFSKKKRRENWIGAVPCHVEVKRSGTPIDLSLSLWPHLSFECTHTRCISACICIAQMYKGWFLPFLWTIVFYIPHWKLNIIAKIVQKYTRLFLLWEWHLPRHVCCINLGTLTEENKDTQKNLLIYSKI